MKLSLFYTPVPLSPEHRLSSPSPRMSITAHPLSGLAMTLDLLVSSLDLGVSYSLYSLALRTDKLPLTPSTLLCLVYEF